EGGCSVSPGETVPFSVQVSARHTDLRVLLWHLRRGFLPDLGRGLFGGGGYERLSRVLAPQRFFQFWSEVGSDGTACPLTRANCMRENGFLLRRTAGTRSKACEVTGRRQYLLPRREGEGSASRFTLSWL